MENEAPPFYDDLDALDLRKDTPLAPLQVEVDDLRKAHIYYVGLPPGQYSVEEYWVKNQHAIEISLELMKRAGNFQPAYIVIGNPDANLKRRHSDEKARHEARQIAIKEHIFYEMMAVTIFEDCLDGTSPIAGEISGLPVVHTVLSSNLDDCDEFRSIHKAVSDLYEKDLDFRELVYRCLPEGQRHRRKRHVDSYKTLSELAKEFAPKPYAPLVHADEMSEYTLYQTALVLFIGGHKIGPKREELYNAAAIYASERIDGCSLKDRNLSFETVESDVTVPYQSRKIRDSLSEDSGVTAFRDLSPLLEAHHEPWVAFQERNRGIEGAVSERVKGILLHDSRSRLLDEIRAAQEAILLDVQRRTHRHAAIRVMMTDYARDHEFLSPEEREKMHDILSIEELYEELKTLTQEPLYRNRAMLEAVGALEAVRVPNEDTFERFVLSCARWFPFTIGNLTPKLTRFEHKRRLVYDLVYGGTGLKPDFHPRPLPNHNCGKWKMHPYTFEECLFNPQNHQAPYDDPGEFGENIFKFQLKEVLFEQTQAEWSDFLDLIRIIEGTDLEAIYHLWLNILIDEAPGAAPNPAGQNTEKMQQVLQLFSRGNFHPEFVAFYLYAARSIGYRV